MIISVLVAGAIMALFVFAISVVLCCMAFMNDDGYLDGIPGKENDGIRESDEDSGQPRLRERLL